MHYNNATSYIDSFINFETIPEYSYESSFNLERMHAFLKELGNPHLGLNVIHIAGSKGKGSTCAIIASILKEAGYSVGLYTSPHLVDVCERIRVLSPGSVSFNGCIKKQELIDLTESIKPVAERFRDHDSLGRLSFFEILTALAFLYFREKKLDWVVLETGLGGRLDATSVTEPVASGITSISLEHTDKLGDSLAAIAREKSGIIKGNGVVVTSQQENEVLDVLKEACQEKGVNLHEVGKDIKYSIVGSSEDGEVFDIDGPTYSYRGLKLNLLGDYQVENAALSIGILKSIKNRVEINEESLKKGLENVCWPGRLQVIEKYPYIILDGAQNVASIKAVLSSIKKIFHYKRLVTIFGICSDKDTESVSKELDRASDKVILTKSRSNRAKEPDSLKKNFTKKETFLSDGVEDAVRLAKEIAFKDDLILITGSLYVVGESVLCLK